MRKIIALILVSLLGFSLVSCEKVNEENASKNVIEKFAKDNGYTIGVNSIGEMGECDLKTKDEKFVNEIFKEKSDEYNLKFDKFLDKTVVLFTCTLSKEKDEYEVIFMEDIRKEKLLGVAFYDTKESEDGKDSKYLKDRIELMEKR